MEQYTTKEAAEKLGISPNTIRSWLSKFPDKFLLGVHVIKENGVNRWTEEGLKALEAHKNGEEPEVLEPVYNLDDDPITQTLLSAAADVRARYILNNLASATIHKMRELVATDPEVQANLQNTVYTLTNYQMQPGRLLHGED